MKTTTGVAALAAALAVLAPWPVDGQMGLRGQRDAVLGPRWPGVEMILRQREALELTEAQVGSLEALRQEAVRERSAHAAEMAELLSRARAGQVEREALREELRARRQAAVEAERQLRERVEAVLTEAQRERLQTRGEQARREARAFRMGRESVLRGRGPWLWRGDPPGRLWRR